ncbi:SHOCT domain-containing protein [Paenibacillus senegalensis]|uniref:hypothetical protein n=1 Tax=Paenibacillus senegalensis TaxID=1465766 RepID=UPI00028948CF|nr:hypothetical protein [Paenibacillus senegalensis]
MDLETSNFSFFPFGALFCLTLFCLVAVRIYTIRHRERTSAHNDSGFTSILKSRVAKGEIDEREYHRLKEFLSK